MAICAASTAALLFAGCSSKSSTNTSSAPSITTDAASAALLPAAIKSKGTITFGVDATYSPNEFKDVNGNVTGWDIDLGNSIAGKLGLTPKYVVATFDNIIPSIVGGKYDAGLSSFTDTPEREKTVDFVNYYSAGIQWAASTGTTVDPDNACGLTIAVQTGTTEVDDLNVKSKSCTDAGKPAITILKFDSQDMATQAAVSGRAAAVTADSPIVQYAVKQSAGKLTLIGEPFGVAPYGIPVAKNNIGLTQAIQSALKSLQADGTYKTILEKWGVEAGAVSTITINGK